MKTNIFIPLFFLQTLFVFSAWSQISYKGVKYHAYLGSPSGTPCSNKNVSIKLGFYQTSIPSLPQWEEIQVVTTSNNGLINFVIGTGNKTANSVLNSFDSINWHLDSYFLTIDIDTSTGTNYFNIGTTNIVSVPYAIYSNTVSKFPNGYSLKDLSDADTVGINLFYILKWNNGFWIPSQDLYTDTVSYSYLINHTISTDTAKIVLNADSTLYSDSVSFAFHSNTSSYSINSFYTDSVRHSVYSDTTTFALSTAPAWSITGNSLLSNNSFLGTGDNKSLVFKTNNNAHIFISSIGAIGINNSSPQSLLQIISDEPFISTGIYGSTVSAASNGGTRMIWSPAKGAFRSGYVTGNYWDIDSLGGYSFVTGYNNKASGNNTDGGNYSAIFGSNNTATAGGSIIFGTNNLINKVGTSYNVSNVAIGMNNQLFNSREVVIGDSNIVTGGSCTTIGNYNVNGGNITAVIGYRCVGIGGTNVSMGSYAYISGRKGCFVFSDASSTTYVHALVNNQFVVRASGGIVFYTDPDTTMGVYLASGSGSWSSISSKDKKENFSSVDHDEILKGISQLKIKKWKYRTENGVYHIGVIAQDMYEKFHLGENKTSITMSDMDGIILSCVKALYNRISLVSDSYTDINELSDKTILLSSEFKTLSKKLDIIETSTK